jgi:4-amino-4-deoxy-L-arabinose transferase-like glycosyltransferase
LLDQADTTLIFGDPVHWQLPGRQLYQTLALLRSALAAVGLFACLVAWRTKPLRRRFLLWLVAITVAYLGFYLLFYFQDERYFVRLVPVFCLADGVGVAALLSKWPSNRARAAVVVVVGALIGKFMVWNAQIGLPAGEQHGIYEGVAVARRIEWNAVVVSNFDPYLLDAYIIRGTDRTAVPLGHDEEIPVFTDRDSTPAFFSPFVASRDPERLRELLHSGRPVYWLIDSPWRKRPAPELKTLAQSFRLTLTAAARFQGRPNQPFLGRIYDLPQQH